MRDRGEPAAGGQAPRPVPRRPKFPERSSAQAETSDKSPLRPPHDRSAMCQADDAKKGIEQDRRRATAPTRVDRSGAINRSHGFRNAIARGGSGVRQVRQHGLAGGFEGVPLRRIL